MHSSPRWLGAHFFLLGSMTPCKSLVGSAGFVFSGWQCYPCYGLSSPQPVLLSPHVSVTGVVMKTHFLSEKMISGHRHPQNKGTAVSESFPSKGWASAFKASAMP